MSEVAAGVYRLEAPLGEQFVCIFVVVGETSALVVDTGVASSPEATVGVLARDLGVDISHVVVSHADVDHCGGISSMRAIAPGAAVMCSRLDRPLIDSVEALIDHRYREFRHEYDIDEDEEFLLWVRQNDDGGSVDAVVDPPLTVDLGGRTVELLGTPGHTRGHLTVLDPATGTAIVADAVLAGATPNAAGIPAYAPTYRYVSDYRETISKLRDLAPEIMLGSHFPAAVGATQVGAFLDASDAFVNDLEGAVEHALERSGPLTVRDLIGLAAPSVRSWPSAMDITLAGPVVGHLEDLAVRGRLQRLPGIPATFVREADGG